MTTPEENPDEKFLITFSDLIYICRKSKKAIFCGILAMTLLGALWALLKPVEYKVEGTFREKSPKPVNMGSSLAAMLMSGGGTAASQENEAIASLKSRKFMAPVITKMGLQASIIRDCDKDTYLRRLKENLKVQYAHLQDDMYPSLPDISCSLSASDIHYEKEFPLFVRVVFNPEEETYSVKGGDGVALGEGKIGQPFETDAFKFTLHRDEATPLSSDPYAIILWPLNLQADRLSKVLKIEMDRTDKNLLKFSYTHRDRQHACKVINTIMSCYQDYLKNTHDQQAELQLAYLEKRREETGQQLEEIMHNHALSLSQDLSSYGFSDSKKEMDFLANSQHQYKEQLHDNELEIKRLQSLQMGQCAYYDIYTKRGGDASIINNILERIRELKQQRDSLEIALRQSPFSETNNLEETFQEQILELNKVQFYSQELNEIIAKHRAGEHFDTTSEIFNDPQFLIKTWHKKLFEHPHADPVDRIKETKQFSLYLENLLHLFNVHEKIIRERLTHQQNQSLEFQGIDLEVALDLYKTCSLQLNDLEVRRRKNNFLLGQMDDPDFEISSLGTALDDALSRDIASKASELLMQLKDENNRTSKEQDRIRQELELQRQFLLQHLQQSNQIINLNQDVVKEKIYTLQNVMLELIHQRIFLFEKNLGDYIRTRLDNLKQERTIIQEHLEELHQEMSNLPIRWVAEQLIEQNVEINQTIVEEIAKMVESKNISHKLELIQSAPIDIATPPIHPISPNMLLYAFLGAVLGGFCSVCFVIANSVTKGIQASPKNLKTIGQHISGELSSNYRSSETEALKDQDLATLRRLQSYFSEGLSQSVGNSSIKLLGQSLLLIEGKEADYSADLATLFLKQGLKVLTLSLSFDKASAKETGLLQYLEGRITSPEIRKSETGDYIEAGGISRFSTELLNTQAFRELLFKLREKYDWVLAVSKETPVSAEAESLISIFPFIALSVNRETISDLTNYTRLTTQMGRKVSFIFTHKD